MNVGPGLASAEGSFKANTNFRVQEAEAALGMPTLSLELPAYVQMALAPLAQHHYGGLRLTSQCPNSRGPSSAVTPTWSKIRKSVLEDMRCLHLLLPSSGKASAELHSTRMSGPKHACQASFQSPKRSISRGPKRANSATRLAEYEVRVAASGQKRKKGACSNKRWLKREDLHKDIGFAENPVAEHCQHNAAAAGDR